MKSTGRYNPITGDEIFRAEEHDITVWDKAWEDLTIDEKAMFCSFIEAPYLASKGEFNNESKIKARYDYFKTFNEILENIRCATFHMSDTEAKSTIDKFLESHPECLKLHEKEWYYKYC